MEDQHSRSNYEDVLITASLIKTDTGETSGTVGTPSMLCVIRRPDDEGKHHIAENSLMPLTPEHVTLKLDLSGKIIGIFILFFSLVLQRANKVLKYYLRVTFVFRCRLR